jgi:hypothetical protein
MYPIFDIWHSALALDELLDESKIVFLAVFEALTVVEDEMVVVGRDDFVIDVRYACFPVCNPLLYGVIRRKIRNAEGSLANLLLARSRKQY